MTLTAARTGRTARAPSRPPRRQRRRRGDGIMPYLLILPGLVFYVLFVLSPIVGTVRLSFFQWDGLTPAVWVGWRNFREVLADPTTWASFKVAGVFVIFNCVLPVVVALVLVGIIARTKVRGLSFFRTLFFLPYTIAIAVVAIGWRWLYALDGAVNDVVGFVFGKSAKRAFLGDFHWALPALGLVAFWATFGFVVVLLLSGVQHVPKELYDAARVDGAGAIREFFAVTLPGVRHELRVALVMTMIMSLRVFDLPLMATQGGPGDTTTTPSLTMYRDVFVNGEIGQGSTIAVLLTVALLIGIGLINLAFRSE